MKSDSGQCGVTISLTLLLMFAHIIINILAHIAHFLVHFTYFIIYHIALYQFSLPMDTKKCDHISFFLFESSCAPFIIYGNSLA